MAPKISLEDGLLIADAVAIGSYGLGSVAFPETFSKTLLTKDANQVTGRSKVFREHMGGLALSISAANAVLIDQAKPSTKKAYLVARGAEQVVCAGLQASQISRGLLRNDAVGWSSAGLAAGMGAVMLYAGLRKDKEDKQPAAAAAKPVTKK